MKPKIIRAALRYLLSCDGQPMEEDPLIEAIQIACRPERPTDADVRVHLATLEELHLISGVTDELIKVRSWTLTEKGVHKARQL